MMDIVLLVKSIAGLTVILAMLLFVFLYSPKAKKRQKTQKKVQKSYTTPSPAKPKTDWKSLIKVLRNRESTTEELKEALDLMLKYHGKIPEKLGIRVNPEFDKYAEAILRLCRHPNTNKELIIDFDRELERKNPEYIKEINDALTKGLNSRGI